MKDSTQWYIWLIVLVLFTAFECMWFWFIVKRPEKWAAWVDIENDFWVRKGIVSSSFVDRMRRREKGLTLKLLVGAGALLGIGSLAFFGYLFFKHGLP